MKIDDLYPWNWFKDENAEEMTTARVPVERNAALIDTVSDLNPTSMPSDIDPLGAMNPRYRELFSNLVAKPLADIAGDANNYEIKLDVPGFARSDISIELNGECLTITGKSVAEYSEEDGKQFYHVERRSNTFQRMLTLPNDCDKTAIEAELNRGVLTITIPRANIKPEDRQLIEIKSKS